MGKGDLDILLEKYEELHGLLSDCNQEDDLINRIHEIIQKAIYELPKGTKIGFRPYGMPTRWLMQNFDFSYVEIVGIFDKSLHFIFEGVPVYKTGSEEEKNVDVFIMTSFYGHDEIIAELKRDQYTFLDIYNCLEQKGIRLYAPVDSYMKGCPAILHDYIMRWKNAEQEDREAALKGLLTAACEAKDFVMFQSLCERYAENYSFASRALEKYGEFYDLISSMISKRKQRDIILYWLDAVPYKWKEYFKELTALEKEGLCFEQAYTCTPYTDQTLRAIFSGLLPLTDWQKSLEQIGYENSELIRYLSEKHYTICRIGEDTPIVEKRCLEEKFSDSLSVNISCNTILWKILCRMLASSDPAFMIAGFSVETHPPMLCAELENLVDVYKAEDPLAQFQISARYLEQRIMFYHKIMRGGRRIQIVMSDHGEHITDQFPKYYWAQHKLHAYCFLTGNGVSPERENRIFSYLKFMELIKWLVEPEKYNYEDCFSNYAVFQDTDIYSAELISRFIESEKTEVALAYRGALDGMYKYAVNGIGREFFYKIVKDEDVVVTREEASERFEKLEREAGTDFPDLSSCEKFKNVPLIYEAMKGKV